MVEVSKPTLAILIYHRVLDRRDPLRPFDVDRKAFTSQLHMLRRWFNVVPLGDGVRRLFDQTLPRRAVAITFDDGYRDNLTNAVPLLQAAGMTATFFVATAYSDRHIMFNDLVIEAARNCRRDAMSLPGVKDKIRLGDTIHERRAAIGRILEMIKYLPLEERQTLAEAVALEHRVDLRGNEMMVPREIRQVLARGMEIGAHTVHHPILMNLPDADAQAEIVHSKKVLESVVDQEIRGFAYPNGRFGKDFSLRDVEIASQAGFEYAVTTDWAASSVQDDPYRLPRISVGIASGLRTAATILKAKLARLFLG